MDFPPIFSCLVAFMWYFPSFNVIWTVLKVTIAILVVLFCEFFENIPGAKWSGRNALFMFFFWLFITSNPLCKSSKVFFEMDFYSLLSQYTFKGRNLSVLSTDFISLQHFKVNVSDIGLARTCFRSWKKTIIYNRFFFIHELKFPTHFQKIH